MSEIQSGLELTIVTYFFASHIEFSPKRNALDLVPHTLLCQSADLVRIFASGVLTRLACRWTLVG